MTPTNPDNNQPLIYRIADALGITHLAVAVQHSHLMSEITGLVSALAGKSDTNHTHRMIQYNPSSPTDGSAGFSTTGEGSFSIDVKDDKSIGFGFGGTTKARITKTNADNLARALQNPDTTPTAGSSNLVTSGGVAAALAEKMDDKTIDHEPANNSDHLVSSKGVYDAIDGLRQDTDHYLEGKMDKMPIDSTPSNNSDHLVSSKGVYDALASKADDVNVRYNEFEKSDAEEVIDLDEVFSNDHMVSHFILQNLTNASCNISDFFTAANANILDNGETVPQYAFAIVKVIMYDNGSTTSYFVVVDGIYEM